MDGWKEKKQMDGWMDRKKQMDTKMEDWMDRKNGWLDGQKQQVNSWNDEQKIIYITID